MTRVRVAVVGLGYWGPQLVRNLYESPHAELAAVCDARPEALAPLARRYPGVRQATDLGEILADPEIEAVVVATPISTHYPLARAALESGKHTFVEKPLAGSLEEASELVAVATKLDLVLMPGHTFLYSPPVHAIRNLIASGELGEIYFVSTSRVNLGLHQSDASVIWDLGPHDFSILSYWLQEPPVRVSALSRGCVMPETPDVAFIQLEYASGVIANVELAWLAPSKLRRTTVVGSHKMVVYDDTSVEPVRVFDSGVNLPDPATFGEYRLSYRTGDIVSPRVAVAEPLELELEDFCTAIRTGSPLRSTPALGVEVVRIVEAAERSLAEGARVTVPDAAPPVGSRSA
ncbi:MAG: Gfo/Idh/MocA family oxidoreductase [Gaiellaceae bacterium MAG52_C11]|nr:Gfo/Idh/MocA family oxidoreductase [Candidatus Gaiellasilicea maunaloa]